MNAPEARIDLARLDDPFAEFRDQPVMRLDDRLWSFIAARQQRRMGCIVHRIIGAVADALGRSLSKENARLDKCALGFAKVAFRRDDGHKRRPSRLMVSIKAGLPNKFGCSSSLSHKGRG